MGMVVSVISPHTQGNGNTVTAIFTALGIGTMKKKVLLTHTDAISNSLYMYLGLHNFEDKTSTPTQMVKLLKEGAIQAEAIPDYCKNIDDNTYVFTNKNQNFTDEDMESFSRYLVENSDFDYIVYDFNNFNSKTADYILKKTDVVILNFTQSFIELDKFKEDTMKYAKMLQGKKILVVCNKFENTVASDKDVVKRLGLKAPVQVIHYNKWVAYGCNKGTLLNIYKNIRKKDSRVIELNSDINKLVSAISKIRIQNLKTKQEERRLQNRLQKGGLK